MNGKRTSDAIGNSRLVLAISAAFAAALVGPCGFESGGLHFRGNSSVGKTTALAFAGSVWGGGDNGYFRSWKATANGLEGVAVVHSDALLCLDEIAQLTNSKEAGDVAYMLANGQGKSRASRDATLRRPARWKTLFLSTGEVSLADKIAEDQRGRRQTAGQAVRVIDLPSDTGRYGLFDDLHGFPSASAFAEHFLRGACDKYFGTAARAFIKAIAPKLEHIASIVKEGARQFVDDNCGDDCDGQVKRVAARFGLIGAAGEMAINLEILPWAPGEAFAAATACFKAWLDARGGKGAAEERDGITAVRAYLSQHGPSRFPAAWETSVDLKIIINLAGFRKRVCRDEHFVSEDDDWDFYITTDAWNEVTAGINKRALAETLVKRAFLIPENDRHRSKQIRVPALSIFSRTWLKPGGTRGTRGTQNNFKKMAVPVAKMKGEQGEHSCSQLEKEKKGEQLRGNM